MFERGAQVNAKFAGGSGQQAQIVAGLRALGLEDDQVTAIARADPGDWRPPPTPGLFARLRGLLGPPQATAALPPADMLIMVHLGQDDALARPAQELFRRFGATTVEYYPAGRIATHVIGEGVVDDREAAIFRAAFPEGERRGRRR